MIKNVTFYTNLFTGQNPNNIDLDQLVRSSNCKETIYDFWNYTISQFNNKFI